MIEFVHQYTNIVAVADGRRFVARAYAAQQPHGLWEAWFVFFPVHGGDAIATDRETTQSKLGDVHYWAGGIEPTYLEGALKRALEHSLAAPLERHAAPDYPVDRVEAEAIAYRLAAEEALAQARITAASKMHPRDEQSGDKDKEGSPPR